MSSERIKFAKSVVVSQHTDPVGGYSEVQPSLTVSVLECFDVLMQFSLSDLPTDG